MGAALASSVSLAQQQAVASSGLNVPTGRSTSAAIVGHIEDGDAVTLLERNAKQGYFIETKDAVEGWAWAARLHVISTAPAPVTPPATLPAGFDPTWARVPSNAARYHWPGATAGVSCAAIGEGSGSRYDSTTNRWKNRSDSSATYYDVTRDALAALPIPRNSTAVRAHWTQTDLDALALFEGLPLRVTAFLSGVKVEGGESTNCGESDTTRVDWHVYLSRTAHSDHKHAVVIEVTPRVRALHPNWKTDDLQAAATNGDSVRISGWLMFDPLHYDQMWQYESAADTTGIKARVTLLGNPPNHSDRGFPKWGVAFTRCAVAEKT
jgi:hypothetical protein